MAKKKSKKRTNDNVKKINEIQEVNVTNEAVEEDETDFLDDEDRLDLGQLQSLIDEIEDIKPYEERRARKSQYVEQKPQIRIDLRSILLVAVLVLSVALLSALIVDVVTHKEDSGNEALADDVRVLKDVTNKDIISLVNNYIEAVQNCDMKRLETLVDNIENVSEEKLQRESEYIEKYENIQMKFIKGLHEDEFVIFVSYDNKILNIDTLTPGAMMLYVVNGSSGYRVRTGVNKDTELMDFINKLGENESVVKFNEDIDNAFKEACKKDKKLAEFIDAITPTQNDKEITKEEETKKNEETTEKPSEK